MAYRIILSPSLTRQNDTRTGQSTTTYYTMTIIRIIIIWIIPIIIAVLIRDNNRKILDYFKNENLLKIILIVIFGAVPVLLFINAMIRNHSTTKKGKGIALYSFGIQIGTILSSSSPTSTTNLSDVKLIPEAFIPRDSIVDCIVIETIYSYKVQSIVALRICNTLPKETFKDDNISINAQQEQSIKDYNLFIHTRKVRESTKKIIPIFPDDEMTYMECLRIRSQINNYLMQWS
jgi:hypothetical protein